MAGHRRCCNGDGGGFIKQSGGISKAEAKKRTSRAAAINTNPALAKKLTNGDISTEQLDNVAEAADKTGGEAVLARR